MILAPLLFYGRILMLPIVVIYQGKFYIDILIVLSLFSFVFSSLIRFINHSCDPNTEVIMERSNVIHPSNLIFLFP